MTPTLGETGRGQGANFKKPILSGVARSSSVEKPPERYIGLRRNSSNGTADFDIGDSSALRMPMIIELAVGHVRGVRTNRKDFYVRVNNRRLWLRLDFIQKRDLSRYPRPDD